MNKNKGKVHRRNGMQMEPSATSGNLYTAMILLGRSLELIDATYLEIFRQNAYIVGLPTMVVYRCVLIPIDGHVPLMLGSIIGADQKV